jgi:hypothetical protein
MTLHKIRKLENQMELAPAELKGIMQKMKNATFDPLVEVDVKEELRILIENLNRLINRIESGTFKSKLAPIPEHEQFGSKP